MSYTVGDLVDAVNIQENLDMVFANVQDPIQVQKVPFTQWLNNPMNRGRLYQSVAIGNGQTRTVEVQYDQEWDAALVTSNVTNPTCTGATYVPTNNSQEYTIDTSVNRGVSWKITRGVVETAKVTPSEYFNRSLAKAVAAVEWAVELKEAAAAVAAVGGWSTDVTDWATASADVAISGAYLQVQTRQTSSSVNPYPYTAQNIATAAELNGYVLPPMIFSGTSLRDWATIGDAASYGLMDNGINLQALFDRFGFAVQYSRAIKTAYSDNDKALMIHPGALQLLAFTQSDWRSGMPLVDMGSNYASGVIFGPRTGIPMDFTVSDNCGTINCQLVATTSVVALPTDMFNPNNQYTGVTFTNSLEVANT